MTTLDQILIEKYSGFDSINRIDILSAVAEFLKQERPKREECKHFNKIRGCTLSHDESVKCNEKKRIIDKFVKDLGK